MLPATYVESSTLKVDQTAVGIFGIAILTAGFSFSALLTFIIRNPLFQAEAIHQPCGIASIIGLLTVFYDFIVSSTYVWKIHSLLLAIAAGISTIVYAGLFLLSQRRISQIRSQPRPADHVPLAVPLGSASPARTSFTGPAVSTYEPTTERSSSYQPTGYYENYIRNMYPTSARSGNSPPGEPTGTGDTGYDPHSISEEEMQRQQMLMLLLANDQPPQLSQQRSTYNIDWEGQDLEPDSAPAHGYYAPGTGTGSSSGVGTGSSWPSVELPAPSRFQKLKMKPWDGVWRGVTRRVESQPQNLQQQQQQQHAVDVREERRREIELGLR